MHAAGADERDTHWSVALFGGTPHDLYNLSALARERGLADRAETLEEVAMLVSIELSPEARRNRASRARSAR